jgi:hypothetical protein
VEIVLLFLVHLQCDLPIVERAEVITLAVDLLPEGAVDTVDGQREVVAELGRHAEVYERLADGAGALLGQLRC